ncbi:MAG: metallophosphoesterase [Planctomycetes bacterium]|nr:metallophosphoesterase [Planctomycetota bacterium]
MAVDDWDIDLQHAPSGNAGEVIDAMGRAGVLARRDPKRRGNVVYLPEHGEILVTGDIHGCRPNFERLIAFADLDHHPNRHLVLHEVIHGGPTDGQGGDLSWQLLEAAARLKIDYPDRVHILLANHDVAEMLGIQLRKGSVNLTQSFWKGLQQAYGPQAAEVKKAYCDFFKALPLAIKTPNRVWISHSTPHLAALADFKYDLFERELVADDFTRESQLYSYLWGRNQDDMAARIFCRHVNCDILIVGHQPSQMGFKMPNSHHIILYSDNQLGRYLLLPLDQRVTQSGLSYRIAKITDLPRPESA